MARLNQRLASAGIAHRVYPEGPGYAYDPSQPRADRLFVAVDGDEVRGGVWLTEQDCWIGGQVHRLGWVRYPVAESLIDSRYRGVPSSLLLGLSRQHPHLMALGLGGHDSPLSRLLAGLHWAGATVPFLFLIARPTRVLRYLAYPRRRPLMRLLMDAAAITGTGWIAWRVAEGMVRPVRRRLVWGADVRVEPGASEWADAVWARACDAYGFLALRDARALRALYDTGSLRDVVTRLVVRRAGEDVGWACVTRLSFADDPDPYFGSLTVGVIADGLALPENVPVVLAAATDLLLDSGVDLIVSNQLHSAWSGGLRRLGYLRGPSNFAFYVSRSVRELLPFPESGWASAHVNRGDCDGPVWR